MRLVTFRAGGGARLGVLRGDDEVVEVTDPSSMLELIDAGAEGLTRVRAASESANARSHRLDGLELLPPLPEPRGNVIAIGRNYQKHAEESAGKEGRAPKPPTVFTKAITSLTEPFADIAIDPGRMGGADSTSKARASTGRAQPGRGS
jgi:2-keto-4-pentenoate hydratase/2-oxohepta-3-ene-1,7-dioic acid hydratase in catechol pathway